MIIKNSIVLISISSIPFIDNDICLIKNNNNIVCEEFYSYKDYSPTLDYKVIDMDEISKKQTDEILNKIMIDSIEKFNFK